MKFESDFTTVESVIQQLYIDTQADNNLSTEIQTIIDTQYANFVTRLKTIIRDLSRQLEFTCNRTFVPYIDTKYFNHHDIDDRTARLQVLDDLLSITTLTNGNGDELTSSQYRLYPRNQAPYDEVYPLYSQDAFWYVDAPDDEITIEGVWGYHRNPDRLWLDNGDTLPGSVTASATSITVNDADGYEQLQYIKINAEYLQITDLDTGTDALTVRRGIRGSTAAAHTAGDSITVLNIDPVAAEAVRRAAVVVFKNPTELETVYNTPVGVVKETQVDSIPTPPIRYVMGSNSMQ